MAFVGPDEVACFRALVIAKGLLMYHRHKMLPNRSYTPSRMIDAARAITGAKIKARDYLGAHDLLVRWVDKQRENPIKPPFSMP